ncbi:reverse transcriptase domain-containing protein [Paenisporosarcina sp. TG20]|uniref:reverse transcriptase domain-containing protein n=1 Tax=Paenisporosarcina sp. TG20 TaxID=1211706 RepID=UPI00031532C9|nr:reverse transcriptase domain-containing protein [Paenisporosarcina sp. TG20]
MPCKLSFGILNRDIIIYDADIKGFFDNIPHKSLMKVLKKFVSDRTALCLIEQFLHSGYMEDGKVLDIESGTPQGGVISPLLANVYLNELDWELDLHGLRFVRYADDFLIFAKSKEDIQRAITITKTKLAELGLEIAEGKTRVVDFKKEDFDFLGFTFQHWQLNEKGKSVFFVLPKEESIKDFRLKIKRKTPKILTLDKEEWINRVNPIIRGKVNYYSLVVQAIQENTELGQKSHCVTRKIRRILDSLDGYIRRRLRVAFIHEHPSQIKEYKMRYKWNNEFFISLKLVPSLWLYLNKAYDMTLEDFARDKKNNAKRKYELKKRRAKEKGVELFTSLSLQKMRNAWNA